MHVPTCALRLGALMLFGVLVSGEEPGRRPLDLPVRLPGGSGEADGDQPEVIIFYGQEYEADAFFWCLDRSCSMAWGSPPPLDILKQEATQAIQSLSSSAQFGIVAFSSGLDAFSPDPVRASPAAKIAAVTWVQALTADGLTCLGPAGVATLGIAQKCRMAHRSVIILSDGEPNCPDCADATSAITTANWERLPVHTISIGSSNSGATCLQGVAAANGGTFTHVQ